MTFFVKRRSCTTLSLEHRSCTRFRLSSSTCQTFVPAMGSRHQPGQVVHRGCHVQSCSNLQRDSSLHNKLHQADATTHPFKLQLLSGTAPSSRYAHHGRGSSTAAAGTRTALSTAHLRCGPVQGKHNCWHTVISWCVHTCAPVALLHRACLTAVAAPQELSPAKIHCHLTNSGSCHRS